MSLKPPNESASLGDLPADIAKIGLGKDADWVQFDLDIPDLTPNADKMAGFRVPEGGTSPTALLKIALTIRTSPEMIKRHHDQRVRKSIFIISSDLPDFIETLQVYGLIFSVREHEALMSGSRYLGLHCTITINADAQKDRYAPLLGHFSKLHGPNNICELEGCDNKRLKKSVASRFRPMASDQAMQETIYHCLRLMTRAAKCSANDRHVEAHELYGLSISLWEEVRFNSGRHLVDRNTRHHWVYYMGGHLLDLLKLNYIIAKFKADLPMPLDQDKSVKMETRYLRHMLDRSDLGTLVEAVVEDIGILQPDDSTTGCLLALNEPTVSSIGLDTSVSFGWQMTSFWYLLDGEDEHGQFGQIFRNRRFGPIRLIIGKDNIPKDVRDKYKYLEILEPVPIKGEKTNLAWKAPWVKQIKGKQYYL